MKTNAKSSTAKSFLRRIFLGSALACMTAALILAGSTGPWVPVALALSGGGGGGGTPGICGTVYGASTQATTPTHPQILFVVTNSQSMDGTTSGADFVGSGQVSNGNYGYAGSWAYSNWAAHLPPAATSPNNYTVPSGFVPPLTPASSPSAPYSVTPVSPPLTAASAAELGSAGYVMDNGATRLNMAKAAISSALQTYAGKVDFALEGYYNCNVAEENTWVYYTSPSAADSPDGKAGFYFTNTPVAQQPGINPATGDTYAYTVTNPCYNNTANADCTAVKNFYASSTTNYWANIELYPYILVRHTSDEPTINDVFQVNSSYGSMPTAFVLAKPQSTAGFTLSQYNGIEQNYASPVVETLYKTYSNQNLYTYAGYSSQQNRCTGATNGKNCFPVYPTNSGFLPTSQEVLFFARGRAFSYNSYADTGAPQAGAIIVDMQTAGSNPTAASTQSVINTFAPALSPETTAAATYEMKSAANQSAIASLFVTANQYLNSLGSVDSDKCNQQSIVLITDGLPTQDLNGNTWPPLGSAAAQQYGITAAYNADGSLASTNDQALQDTITTISKLASAGIKTYVIGVGAGVNQGVNPAAAAAINAMAIAGGTQQAYPVTNQVDLNMTVGAIVGSISVATAAASPTVPASITAGAFIYSLVTNTTPVAGHVYAYTVNSQGVPSGSSSWDAGAQMNATNRNQGLYSSGTTGAATLLSNLDAAAFGLSSPPSDACAPNPSVITSYTVNPSYTYTLASGNVCTYLGDRQPGWFLGAISNTNNAVLLNPPGTPADLSLPGYTAFASAAHSRPQMLLYTSADGFLYASDAQTGAFDWGWMPRASVADLQNYTGMQSLGLMSGRFNAVDAYNGTTNQWATYLVGNGSNGGSLYDLQLTNSGMPQQEITLKQPPAGATLPVSGAVAVFNVAGTALNPSGYSGVSQIAAEVVNSGTTAAPVNTLIEFNVATGASSQATIPSRLTSGFITSRPFVDPQSGVLYLGDAIGNVYTTSFTGNASTDASNLSIMGATQDGNPVHYIGIGQVNGAQFIWAATTGGITVFGTGVNGFGPLWATTPSGGYTYDGKKWVSNSTIAALQTGGTVSDAPTLVNNILVVPVYVPQNQTNVCGNAPGNGYYDFYTLSSGTFPQNQITDTNGNYINGPIDAGAGAPYSASVSLSSSGVPVFGGSAGTVTPSNPFLFKKTGMNTVTQWRAH